jgi:hypothetical protein
MRRVAADYIFPVSGPPLKNGIIEFDDQGKILSLTDTHGNLKETSRLEYYNGVLVPGLILPCCRIEPFIFRVDIRDFASLKRFISREPGTFILTPVTDARYHELDIKLHQTGIRGIGCITNRFHFFRNKSEGSINYHSFIEIPPEKQPAVYELFNKAIEDIMNGWNDFGLSSSVIPFNCRSEEIMSKIADFSTVHENPLILGCPRDNPTSILDGFSAILSRISGKEKKQALLDFRNTVIIISDNLSGLPEGLNDKTFLLFSMDSSYITDNQIIEKDYLTRFSGNILFSRHFLTFDPKVPVISDMLVLQYKFPWLTFEDLIRWFTLNPARALGMDHHSGSLIPGKKPGINLITNFNFDEFKLRDTSEIKPII